MHSSQWRISTTAQPLVRESMRNYIERRRRERGNADRLASSALIYETRFFFLDKMRKLRIFHTRRGV
jgi:hypothetical protein